MGKGDMIMNDNSRKIGDITSSTFGDNSNLQGDNVSQNKIVNINESKKEEAFQELFSQIEELKEQTTKEQAQFNAEELKKALESGDTKKSQKLLGFLQSALGAASSLATIAQLFGLSIPPISI